MPISKYALKNVAETSVVLITHISTDIPIAKEQKYSFRETGNIKDNVYIRNFQKSSFFFFAALR